MAALFFAGHPIHTESVTWIKNRHDLLASLFLLSSLSFFIKLTCRRKGKLTGEESPLRGEGRGEEFPLPPGEGARGGFGLLFYSASLFCFVLAILSKEMALSLPFVLVIYVLCFLPRKEYKKAIIEILPFLGMAISFFVFKQVVLGRLLPSGHTHSIGFHSTILAVFKTIGQYIRLLVFPYDLNADRSLIVPKSFFEVAVLWSAVLTPLCLIVALKIIRRSKLASFSIFWIFLTLLPASNILFLSGRPIAEQRLYIPSLGFCILLAMGIMALPSLKWKFVSRSILRNLTGILFICIVVFYSVATIRRNLDWRDPLTFWSKTLQGSPNSARAHNNLGAVYKALGEQEESIDWYKKAIEVSPAYVDAYCNLGNRYVDLGEKEEAARWYRKAIEINPWHLAAYNNLGKVYSDNGEYEDAIDLYEKAVKVNPGQAGLYSRLADLYYNLANAYSGAGKYEEAIGLYKKALKLEPQDVEALNNLGNVYSEIGKYKEAEVFYKKVIEQKPDYALAYANLSVTYLRQKQYNLAIEHCDKARELGFVEQGLLDALKPYRRPHHKEARSLSGP